MAIFIMHVEKQEKMLTTGNICINWIVTRPWEQGHRSTDKGHRCLSLADFVRKLQSNACKKSNIYRKTIACSWKKISEGILPSCGRRLKTIRFVTQDESQAIFLIPKQKHRLNFPSVVKNWPACRLFEKKRLLLMVRFFFLVWTSVVGIVLKKIAWLTTCHVLNRPPSDEFLETLAGFVKARFHSTSSTSN